MKKDCLKGIYPITPNNIISDDDYLEKCFNAINSGITIFQFRSPYLSSRKKRYLLNEIYSFCITSDVQLIINNDYNLVKIYSGSGIHIGKQDCSIKEVRNKLGSDVIIGFSCGSDIYNTKSLKENGVSYFSLGALYPSATKLKTDNLTKDIINKYNDNKEVPMCIIGGINKKNILSVSKYQPDMIAINDGIFNQDVDNIKKIINELQRVMNEKK
tara:strand:- start:10853 stop:11494 length:642 start_codon:yes stop_codon:yes gene_type:complete